MLEEADLFFGRDRHSDELLRRLSSRRFLAVVGTSGSGKSSLVRAGLLPSLESGFMAKAGTHWRMAILRPQEDPIGFLAQAIIDTGMLSALNLTRSAAKAVVETTLRRIGRGLVEVVQLARLAPHENLLVLVDQFEELFRFADLAKQRDAGDEAPAFVKLLLEAAQQTELPVYVVITMRSDFLGDCNRFRGLAEAISNCQYLIPRLTRDELEAAITGPIGVRGGRIAPSLVQRLLNDVGDDMDQLPVLQHALMRAWDHWEDDDPDARALDLSDLEAIGGMAEALSRHAEEAYASLATERDRKIAETLFKCLTERGPDQREIRRPTQLSRLAAIAHAQPAEVIQVIEVFRAPGRSFLMPPHDIALDGDCIIDISHESLIRKWGRLHTWVEEEAESRATYLRLVEAARLRQAGKAGLWGEPDLTYARQWQERESPNPTWAKRYASGFEDAMAFLRESTNKVRRKRRRLVVTTTSIALVLIGLTLSAWVENRRAEATIAQAREFTDDLLFSMLDKLKTIERTEDIRLELLRKVGTLSSTLQHIGAEEDQSTKFWIGILEGDIANAHREREVARREFSEARDLAKRVVDDDPDNQDWRRNLSVSYVKLGDLELAIAEDLRQIATPVAQAEDVQAHREAALGWFSESLEVDKRLYESDPNNEHWQRDLSISYGRLGDVQFETGHFDAARLSYDRSLEIAERLARNDEANEEWQHDLSISYQRIGTLSYKVDRLEDAREAYDKSVKIIERLAPGDLSNEDYQRNLFMSYRRLGELKLEDRKLQDARHASTRALNITKRLHDDMTERQRESDREYQLRKRALCKAYMQLGNVEVEARQFKDARSAFNAAMEIAKSLANDEPGTAELKRELDQGIANLDREQSKRGG
jgi:tetratricopeptide (TPR) repeat protein